MNLLRIEVLSPGLHQTQDIKARPKNDDFTQSLKNKGDKCFTTIDGILFQTNPRSL
jgi:hypothetical protein